MRSIYSAGAIASALLLAACVTPTTQMPTVTTADASAEAQKQSELAVKMRLDEKARVSGVAERLFTANADLCPDLTRSLGLKAETVDDFSPPFRKAASASMGFGAAPQVDWIDAKGPAEQAGLKPGDVIVEVDGHAVGEHAAATKALQQDLAQSAGSADVRMKYRRDDQVQEIVIHPLKACNYGVMVADVDTLNASADGRSIVIDRGMLRFVKSDDELALVMAHELAHDTEKHIRAKSTNATVGLVGGATVDVLFALGGVNTGGAFMKAGRAAGAGYASVGFESEADYIGMYYMARAGYDVDGVEDFWRRMAVEEPQSIFVKSDHPASPARYVAIGKTRDEILAKRKAGAPLLPERRAGHKVEVAKPAVAAPAAVPVAAATPATAKPVTTGSTPS
jgi:hypothetical protein